MRSSQPGVRTKRRSVLPRLCDSRNCATGSTMRGSGLHHSTGWPGLNQGKMPLAVGLVQALRREPPPAASRPGASLSGAQRQRASAAAGRRRRSRSASACPHYGSVGVALHPPPANCLTSKALSSKLLSCSMVPRATTHEDRLHRRRPGRAVLRAADEAAGPAPRHHRGRAQQALRHLRLGRGVLRRHHGQHAPVGPAHRGRDPAGLQPLGRHRAQVQGPQHAQRRPRLRRHRAQEAAQHPAGALRGSWA